MSWVEPISFSEETKLWFLMNSAAVPYAVWVDLNKVAAHNDKCRVILGKHTEKIDVPQASSCPPEASTIGD